MDITTNDDYHYLININDALASLSIKKKKKKTDENIRTKKNTCVIERQTNNNYVFCF